MNETNSIPYLGEVLKVNEALLGLPALPLVLLLSIALGYVLKFIPVYPNNWIPIGVIVGAMLANVGIAYNDGSGNYARAFIYGLIVGVASIAIHRKWLRDWLDPKMFGAFLLLGLLALGATGCSTTGGQRPPTNGEVKYYDITTNVVEVVALRTNRTEATETTPASVTVTPVTNRQEQYTFVPNAAAQLTAATGTAVGNIWGVGGAVGGGILGLFTLWGLWRSRKNSVATAAELAQIIETGRQLLLTMPDGAKYEAAWKAWMVKHQAQTQTISQVAQLVALSVDNDKAKGAAQSLVNLIDAQPK